jgi:ribosomal protein S18 acetylase RimI-like enzyme
LDGVLVGYCFCVRQVQSAASMQKISTLYIDDLCVDAAMRGRGIGKVLYDYAVEYARENGYYNLTLNVWACNPSAMRFYEKCGLTVQKVGMELVL